MTIRYTVDHRLALILVRIQETLNAQEVMGYFQAVHPDSSINQYDRLLLIDALRSTMTAREIAAIAHYARQSPGANRGQRTAIVATADSTFEQARHFQAHRQGAPGLLRIFRRAADAARWLELAAWPDEEEYTEVRALTDDFYAPLPHALPGAQRKQSPPGDKPMHRTETLPQSGHHAQNRAKIQPLTLG